MNTNHLNRLIRDIDRALAWGTPDNESTGYSHSEYESLLIRANNYLKQIKEDVPQDDLP